VKVKDHGLWNREQRIEVAVREPADARSRHEAEEIDDVDEADSLGREVLLQNLDGGERIHGRSIARASHHHFGFRAVGSGSPIPDTDALGTCSTASSILRY